MAKIGEQTVQEMSSAAGLLLTSERARILAPQLEALINAANELSEHMSHPRWAAVAPVVRFGHPPDQTEP
jgi:hypothetical protein